jgi:hypothetical protein
VPACTYAGTVDFKTFKAHVGKHPLADLKDAAFPLEVGI